MEYAVASGPAIIVNVYSRHQAEVLADRRRRLGNAATVLCRSDRSEPWRPLSPTPTPSPSLAAEVVAIEAALPGLAANRAPRELVNRGDDGRFATADDNS
jgi:hypothetical protein